MPLHPTYTSSSLQHLVVCCNPCHSCVTRAHRVEAPVEAVGDVILDHPVSQAVLPHAVGALVAPAAPLPKADGRAQPGVREVVGGSSLRGFLEDPLSGGPGLVCWQPCPAMPPGWLFMPGGAARAAHPSRLQKPKWRIQMSGMFSGNWRVVVVVGGVCMCVCVCVEEIALRGPALSRGQQMHAQASAPSVPPTLN